MKRSTGKRLRGARTAARTAARIALACCLVTAAEVGADTIDDWHTWGNVTATGTIGGAGSPWQAWLEAQGRFNDDSSRFNQGILRIGLGRQLAARATLWAGYAFIPTDPRGRPDDIVEHRIWQQLTWRTAARHAGFDVATRTRLEQRTIESADDTGWRVRQFTKLTRPLGASERWYLSLWDEIFVNLNDTDWGADDGFDQNRAFAGIGLRGGDAWSSEVGYLHQLVRRVAAPDASNHILSLNLFLRF